MTQILLAEDEPMLRMLAVEKLEESGFNVLEAGDGEEALALLTYNPQVEMLISDVRMPRMDGYMLAEAGLALKPDLKILLMTGYAHEPPATLRKAHTLHVLRKPFNLERLREEVEEMLALV